MTDTEQPGRATDAADAELADAMESIQSTGEDWRSSERATGTDQNAPGTDGPQGATDPIDEEIDNG